MTEAEWLASDDTTAMLAGLPRPVSDRKLRLFAVACCRRVWHIYDANAHNAIEVAERMADGPVDNSERRAAAVATSRFGSWGPSCAVSIRAAHGAMHTATCTVDECDRATPGPSIRARERAANAALLRDVVGNPFRPVGFNPEWRTGTAVALARTMYDAREFSGMPILADALQDAGCEDEELLAHCRDTARVHFRGCWVCDLVLGRE